jgi:hypothetical protein
MPSPPRPSWRVVSSIVVVAATLALACGSGKGPAPPGDSIDPERPGLAFTRVPAGAVLNGRFELRVRLNDARGTQRIYDDSTVVTVSATGGGRLTGTLQRVADGGFVRFDDLQYDRWETVALTVRAAGLPDLTTPRFMVRPVLRLAEMPPARAPVEVATGPFILELVDGQGALVPADVALTLDSTDPYVIVEGGRERRLDAGRARFDSVILQTEGPQTLTWRVSGAGMVAHGLSAFAGSRTETIWLRAGRVGVRYEAALPRENGALAVVEGALPAGLSLDPGGAVTGTPTESSHARFKLVAVDARGVFTTSSVVLEIMPAVEPAGPALDQLDVPGPFGVGTLEERVPVLARGVTEPARLYFPTAGGVAAPGPFPLVVFHHGAARLEKGMTTLYDHYGPLLARWASHGFVVASVDGISLIYRDGGYVPLTIGNLTLIAENLRAAIAHLRARDRDPTFGLAGHMDLGRVVVAGHSRGAGAAIIAARANPSVLGMLLLKPVDPLTAAGGEVGWVRELPAKPALVVIAGNDADVSYPLVDFLYERRAGPMSAPTILGSLHAWSCDVCPAERGGVPQIRREQDWSITNAYALAFLKYVTGEARGGEEEVLFGRQGLSTALTPPGVLRRSDRDATAAVVDDFQEDRAANALGFRRYEAGLQASAVTPWLRQAALEADQLGSARRNVYLQPDVLAFSLARDLRWTEDGAVYGNELRTIDVSHRAAFRFRARTDGSPVAAAQIAVRLIDDDGTEAVVALDPSGVGRNGIGARFTDVIAPLDRFRSGTLHLERITNVELVLHGRGSLTIDDLRFE